MDAYYAAGVAWCGWTSVPGRSSSVPRPAISSPAFRSPKTSTSEPDVSPVRTSTHSVFPPRTRITKVRSVVEATLALGTKSDGRERRTGHVTVANVPCLLYTSDAADERSSVDLGGRRII